jgi:hypothetical protein
MGWGAGGWVDPVRWGVRRVHQEGTATTQSSPSLRILEAAGADPGSSCADRWRRIRSPASGLHGSRGCRCPAAWTHAGLAVPATSLLRQLLVAEPFARQRCAVSSSEAKVTGFPPARRLRNASPPASVVGRQSRCYSSRPLPRGIAVKRAGAVSSAVEHYLDMVGVTGSIPVPPTRSSGLENGWRASAGRFRFQPSQRPHGVRHAQ